MTHETKTETFSDDTKCVICRTRKGALRDLGAVSAWVCNECTTAGARRASGSQGSGTAVGQVVGCRDITNGGGEGHGRHSSSMEGALPPTPNPGVPVHRGRLLSTSELVELEEKHRGN